MVGTKVTMNKADQSVTFPKKRRSRDPEATRTTILAAARELIAKDGPEGVSLSAVAHLAGVNRGTAYQHFETRENLIQATIESVSDELFQVAFGDPETAKNRPVEDVDVFAITETMAFFAMDNPALCRIWFMQLLASKEPSHARFWRQFMTSLRAFTESDLAWPGFDFEVSSLIMLAGNFLWPVWVKSDNRDPAERRMLSRRFVRECLRLSLYGNMRPERYQGLVERLDADEAMQPTPLAVAGGR